MKNVYFIRNLISKTLFFAIIIQSILLNYLHAQDSFFPLEDDHYFFTEEESSSFEKEYKSIIYPMNYYVFAGMATPYEGVSSFDPGYVLGIEYTNYYTSNIGFVGHLSGSFNELKYSEQNRIAQGQLINAWLMAGGKIETGGSLMPFQLYVQGMVGGNYMMPTIEDIENVENTFNVAYSAGVGIIFKELIHLSARCQIASQKIQVGNQEESMNAAYLMVALGIQF